MARARFTWQSAVLRALIGAGAGELLHKSPEVSVPRRVSAFLDGLHRLPFSHWWLRWVYFAMGFASCVMIATGLLLWIENVRRDR